MKRARRQYSSAFYRLTRFCLLHFSFSKVVNEMTGSHEVRGSNPLRSIQSQNRTCSRVTLGWECLGAVYFWPAGVCACSMRPTNLLVIVLPECGALILFQRSRLLISSLEVRFLHGSLTVQPVGTAGATSNFAPARFAAEEAIFPTMTCACISASRRPIE
jgi:hypothetical protein